jgi:hypothetical protein
MFENMLSKHEPTCRVPEGQWLPEVRCEIYAREIPSVDIHPAWQYPWSATKMKLYIIHLQQDTFLGSRAWRHASPKAHSGQMSLYTHILNDAQGYRSALDDGPRHAFHATQKRQIVLLKMTTLN